MNNLKGKDIMAVGLTMFAIFFGAGNLIFPPYLGRMTGAEWFLGFFFFFIVDIGVSMIAIFATIRSNDLSMTGIPSRLGKKMATVGSNYHCYLSCTLLGCTQNGSNYI